MNRTITIMTVIFGVVGLGLLVGAGYAVQSSVQFKNRSRTADGVVVRMIDHRDSDGDLTYKPEVEWADPAGEKRRFTSSVSSSPPAYSVGQHVTVLFDPSDPAQARIDGFTELWLLPMILGIIGVVFTGVSAGFVVHGVRKRSQRNWLAVFGRRIEANITGIELNRNLTVMNKHPWNIHAQWLDPATNTVHTFRSDSIWFDPTQFVGDRKTVDVVIDPNRLKVYQVDISFLPKHSG